MKRNVLILISIIAMCFFIACEIDEPTKPDKKAPDEPTSDNVFRGFVAACDRHHGVAIEGEYGKSTAYVIVSSDLRDTVFTGNLPDSLFNFPVDCFSVTEYHDINDFPEQYQRVFYVEFTHRPANEAEIVCYIRNHQYPFFENPNYHRITFVDGYAPIIYAVPQVVILNVIDYEKKSTF